MDSKFTARKIVQGIQFKYDLQHTIDINILDGNDDFGSSRFMPRTTSPLLETVPSRPGG